MPATAPVGSVISGTYRATAGASSGAIGMWLGSYAYTAGTTYNFTFTGMQGSQSLALYVYQYNSAGTDKVQISSNAYSITTSAATVSGSFTANLYPATYTGSIVFFFQALAVNQYVNFTAFSMNTGAMNVGIGTTNPSNILDVRPVGTGDAPNYGISHYFPATYSATVYANELVASLRFKWYNDLWDISGIRGGSTSWQSLAIRYNGTEFITVGAGGNVGIGVTGPSYTLDVAGYARATSGLLAGNGTGAVSLQLFDLPAAAWQITTGGYNLSINNNSASWTNRVTINQSGQVGIGTNSPAQLLHVYGTNPYFYLGATASNYNVAQFSFNTISSGNTSNYASIQLYNGPTTLCITGLGYVGIGMTNPTNPLTVLGSMTTQGQLFAVGGNTSTYYPVLIDAGPSWATSNTYKFTVSRSNVHMDASWKGATTIMVEGHNYDWGNGADFMKYKIIGSTSGPVSWSNFVANIFEDSTSTFIVVYLRGASTYYFSGQGCLLNNANASGATLTVPAGNGASYASTTSVTAPFGSTVASGDFRDNIWSVGGNVGIGKSNPSQLLDVNGAINCTSFLVNGTAVATGTGSVWGVNGSIAYYTSGYVGVGTNNPLTTNLIGANGGNGMDVWSTTAFDAWAKIRILCNASQYGRTSLEMIGRLENSNDGWSLNGGRNNIVFGYQTSQGSAISYVNAIQSYNGQMGFFSSGYSSANPAMMLNATGNVGIGTVSPTYLLHLYNASPGILFTSSSYTSNPWYLFVGTSNGAMYLSPNTSSATPGCNVAIGASSWSATSDVRLKKSITPILSALDNILQLNPVLFKYKTDSDDETLREGFIAQEVRSIFPSKWIVGETGMPEQQIDDNGESYHALSLSTTQFIPHIVKAIQEIASNATEQASRVRELSSQNEQLRTQLDSVLARLNAAGIML